jgi:putative ABC transport system permease protein
MTGLWQDVRYGLRTLANSPGFTAIAILTLALGIGATTTIFSVIDSVLLNPFPYKNADRLATPFIRWPDQNNLRRFPVAAFLDFKEQNHTFEDMIGLAYVHVRFQARGATEQVWGGWVTPDTFEVLGSKPFLGRPITSEDGKPGSSPVFVMSYEMWVKQFNKDPKLLGATLNLNGVPRTLVAVMPPRFRFGDCEIWMPLGLNRDTFITGFGLTPNEVRTVGHLKSGVSPKAAEADLEVIAKRLEKAYPVYFRPQFKIGVTSLLDDSVREFKLTLFALMAAVAMLLMIACSNVANLLLARATVREREIAIRAAIGATRSRLMRQLLVESFILAAASCIAGCILSYWGLKGVVAAIPPETIPSEVAIALRPAALFFAIGVAVVTTLLCGLAPAIHAVRRDLRGGLVGTGKGKNEGSRHGGLRSALVVAEVTISVVLLVGTGLMLRTLRALERVDIGFNPANILYAEFALPEGRYDTADQKKVFFRKMLDRFNAIPGVTASTVTSSVPPYSWGWTEVEVPGTTHAGHWGTTFNMCSEGYFTTLDRHLLSGRLLSQSDVDSARHATVINQTLARDYFPNENPIGQRIKFSSFEMYSDWPRDPYFEIIGVIADAKNRGLQDPARPEAYFPYTITGIGSLRVMVRVAGNSGGIRESMRREISTLDPDVAVSKIDSVDIFLKRSYIAAPQFILIGLGTFTVIGLLLVIIGVFSVMAYTVSLRTHEIGVRMALGAQQRDLLRMILKGGMVLIMEGAVAGVLVSVASTRLMASQVWGVSAIDPWTFAVVATVILAAGLAACFFPARRASQIDPMVALRFE